MVAKLTPIMAAFKLNRFEVSTPYIAKADVVFLVDCAFSDHVAATRELVSRGDVLVIVLVTVSKIVQMPRARMPW